MKKAFSLIELAVVVVIVALLTGIISAGGKIKERARLQAVVKEIKDIQTASYGFQTIYDALPGDMSNAFEFFENSDCGHTAAAGTKTSRCNGSGNIALYGSGEGGYCREEHNFWNHMQFAKLFYTTLFDCTAYHESSKFKDLAFGVYYLGLNSNPAYDRSLNVMRIGSQIASSLASTPYFTYNSVGKIFSPKQAWFLDNKLDDGIAYSGELQAFNGMDQTNVQGTGCSSTTPNANNSTDYKHENYTAECYLILPINIVK